MSDMIVHIVFVRIQALIKTFTVQVGWLSEGFQFSRKRGSWLPALQHRAGVEPKKIGSFTYDFSKGNLQTIAVDSSIIVDHIRFQVCMPAPPFGRDNMHHHQACLVHQAGELQHLQPH